MLNIRNWHRNDKRFERAMRVINIANTGRAKAISSLRFFALAIVLGFVNCFLELIASVIPKTRKF
ncbi:MAG: hypothetical protein K2W88_20935 [Pararheinheimera sp.]|nr:hypothetical protein [Rheinheimera sp.]